MESREAIETAIITFYKQLYTWKKWDRPRPDGVEFKQLELQKVVLLDRVILEEEIKEEVFGLGEDKALDQMDSRLCFSKNLGAC